MRAEHLVGPLVLEFAEQMEVEVAERWQKAVWIVNRGRSAAAKEYLELIGEQLAPSFHPYLEDSGRMNARHLTPGLLAIDQQRDPLGIGTKRPHHDGTGLHVSAEYGMRVGMFQRDQALQAFDRSTAPGC